MPRVKTHYAQPETFRPSGAFARFRARRQRKIDKRLSGTWSPKSHQLLLLVFNNQPEFDFQS
jgi:hypothetical protein